MNFFKLILDLKSRVRLVRRRLPVTVEYPFVNKPIPALAHAKLKNNFGECVGCLKCEVQCPTKAITINAFVFGPTIYRPVTSKGIPFERNIEQFKVDYAQCVFCGICVDVCPTQSLTFDRKIPSPQFRERELTIDLVHIPRTMRRGVDGDN
jgi:formate hydrogenlyase subunit 6/NADH:ubiquinone oxidoreductase subunit I